jgi:hypothetical protein
MGLFCRSPRTSTASTVLNSSSAGGARSKSAKWPQNSYTKGAAAPAAALFS